MTEAIAIVSLLISALTAWLTLFRRGTVRMTQPTLVAFLADGPDGPKVFLRTLLYSTSQRGQVVENMYLKVHRGNDVAYFNGWFYGDGPVVRGSGIYVRQEGIERYHHFLLPRDKNAYEFRPAEYSIEVYALLVGSRSPHLLSRFHMSLNEHESASIGAWGAGVFFEWQPDEMQYHSHVDERPKAAIGNYTG